MPFTPPICFSSFLPLESECVWLSEAEENSRKHTSHPKASTKTSAWLVLQMSSSAVFNKQQGGGQATSLILEVEKNIITHFDPILEGPKRSRGD